MTSKIIVNTIEADTGISSVTFASNINLQNDSSVLVSSSGIRLGTGSTIAAPSANEIALSTNSAERLRINSSGDVGIGTASADRRLHVYSTNGTVAHFESNNANTYAQISFQGNGAATTPYVGAIGADFQITTGDTERLRITSGGNLGIGDASPTKPLTVGTTTPVILLDDQSSRTLEIRGPSTTHSATVLTTSTHDLLLGTNNAERLRITSNGSIGTKGLVPTDGSFVANSTIRSQNSSSNISYIGFTQYTSNTSVGDMFSYMGGDGRSTGYLTFNTNDTERLRITSNGQSKFTVGTNKYIKFYAATHNDEADLGAGIAFSRPSDGADMLSGIFSHSNTGLGVAARDHITFLTGGTSNVSDTEERLRITSDGYVLKSDTPAFKCKLSGATGANFTGFFVFGNVSYNIGSHYNSSNGRFTAPVDGRYLFAWYTNMERAGGNGSLYADWYINGNAQLNRMYTHHSGAWELIGGTIIFDLNANDYVQIKAITSGNWDGGQYGSYSGYLLG